MVVAAAGVAVVLVGPAASRRPKPPPCPGARYLLEPPLLDAGSPLGAHVSASAAAVEIEGICDAIAPKRYKTTRKGTKVKAKWPSCPGLQGKVKLKGKVIDDCGTFKGKVKAKRFKRKFEAPRDLLLEIAATVGAAGGQVVSGDGLLTLDFPAGALAADTLITIRNLTATELAAAGADAGYALGPDGLFFAQPVTATFALDPVAPDGDGVLEPDLSLLVSADAAGGNLELPAEQLLVLDAAGGEASVSAPIEHFSTLRIFRPRDRVEAQRASIKAAFSPGVNLQTNQAFTVDILVDAGVPQRNEKQIFHMNTVPPGDRVVYSGEERVLVGTIPEQESRGGGTVTGYACGPLAGFGTYSAVLTGEVEPSFDIGIAQFGGSVSLTTDLRVQIGCSAPTTTSTSSSTTTVTTTTAPTVSSTSSTSTSSTTTTSTSTTSTTSSSTTTTTSTSTTTLPEPGGCCECGPGVCASGPTIGPEDCPTACAPMSGTFQANSECNLSTGNCDEVAGRAVILTHTIGSFEMGSTLCLHLVQGDPDGCIGVGPECLDEMSMPAPHLHHTIAVTGVGGGIADPLPDGCGHGRVVEGVSGCLPEDPIVPNCF